MNKISPGDDTIHITCSRQSILTETKFCLGRTSRIVDGERKIVSDANKGLKELSATLHQMA